MSLDIDVALRLGDLDLAAALQVQGGAVTAVLGPNGAGKTTLLRCVAGSVAIDAGSIVLDGRVLDQPGAAFVPPERRRLGVVHQDYLLFPHLSAVENVAFGLRAAGRAKGDARRIAREWLARVGVEGHETAKPKALSGGQAQRVALARALASEPAALLLDEPLAAVDAGTRLELRRDLERFLRGFDGPTLLVTHDPIDVLALADDVAILEAGRVVQSGSVAEVTSQPRSRYVADLIGTNLVHGIARGTTVQATSGTSFTTADPHDGQVFATIAPAAIAIHRFEPEGSPRNRWAAEVSHLELRSDRVRVHLAPPLSLVAEITPAAVSELAISEGDTVWASVKATEVHVYAQ